MDSTIFQKMKVKPDMTALAYNAPSEYPQEEGPRQAEAEKADFVHLFIESREQLEAWFSQAAQAVEKNGLFWISYPKNTGKKGCDISRDVLWDLTLPKGWHPVAQVSLDDKWSAIRLRPNEPEKVYSRPSSKKKGVNGVLSELKALGTEQTKRTYRRHGAREPLFGVTTGAMKPLAKRYKKNYSLAMELYATGNYDAMYFAGMITDPSAMRIKDMEAWMEKAYCHGLSDYVVAVTLAETDFAQELADRWIRSGKELYQSAGWSCYAWLIGLKPDSCFDTEKIKEMLRQVEQNIHSSQNRVRYAMNNFLIAVGISYLPLHEEAVQIAEKIGEVAVDMGETSCKTPLASAYIQKAAASGRLGFKRKNVRC